MRPKEVIEEIPTIMDAGLSLFLHGPTGIGKSDVIGQYCAAENLELRDIRASQLDPVDARGVPVPNHEKHLTEWFPPDFLPTEGEGVIFLDELNKANQDTLAALYQLILDKRLGDYFLPDGWSIMAAGNRDIDGCMVQPMPRALKNRFIHLEMEANYEDWHIWANRKGLVEQVIAYMRWRPTALDEATEATKDDTGKAMEILRNSNAFATPRSWEFVSRGLKVAFAKGRTVKDCYSLIEGTIGEGSATEFISYCDIYMELPDIDLMVDDPSLYVPTTDPNKLYAICAGLASRASKDNFTNVCKVLEKLPPEYSMWAMDDCLDRNKDEISTHPAYIDWIHKNIQFAG